MALPAVIDCEAYRGDSWSQAFSFTQGGVPVDLSGAVVAAEARDSAGVVHALVADLTPPATVTISLPAASLDPGTYSYDVEVTQGADIKTWVRGALVVVRDVTNELAV